MQTSQVSLYICTQSTSGYVIPYFITNERTASAEN